MQVPPIDLHLLVESFIGVWGYTILGLFIAIFLKKYIESAIDSLVAFAGNDLNEDDIVYLKGRKARVARTGAFKTIFYMYDNNTKWAVQNKHLSGLNIEKKLPQNGDKGGE